MIDKWLIVGGAHFAVAAVVLKVLGLILPCCITCYYSFAANFVLYVLLARFTFELTKKWHLNDRLPPENKAVFITGCDSGIGVSLAKRLDAVGYPVFAGFIDPDSVAAKTLQRECTKRLQIVEIDVTNDGSVNNAVEFFKRNAGTSELWAIVNGAEIQKGFEVELTKMDEFRETMEVNAFGLVRVTKAFLPLLRQYRGRIINVTSTAGRLSIPYLTPYSMSKFAAVAFNECLKQELDVWGVRVISVEPEFCQNDLQNTEFVKKKVDATFANLDENVKDDYGEQYLKNFKSFADFIYSNCSGSDDSVTEALDDAISLKYPNSVYKPARNIIFQVAIYILERTPPNLNHALKKLFLSALGFPRPTESENYL